MIMWKDAPVRCNFDGMILYLCDRYSLFSSDVTEPMGYTVRMHKPGFIIFGSVLVLIIIVAVVGLVRFNGANVDDNVPASILTEAQARSIAETSCVKGGEVLSAGMYNEGTKTWWFDANLNATRPGCSPACVVDETTNSAEINWRCTGLISPEISEGVKNATYTIEKVEFVMTAGRSEKAYDNSSSTKNVLTVFGEPILGDLDADGDLDAAVLLEHNPGGSGMFYYAVLVINTDGVYTSTNTLFIGDRISPQTVEIQNGRALYNYAVRKAGEAMTVSPSVGKSLWIHFDGATNEIGEWVADFEGEADPARMTLQMKSWVWIKTQQKDATIVTPKKVDAFTLTFSTDGRVSVKTDCNSGGGSFTVKDGTMTFGQMMTTLMFCDGSQEQVFNAYLAETNGYSFSTKGELILTLRDGGTMYFR